jgi:hypothetical protein
MKTLTRGFGDFLGMAAILFGLTVQAEAAQITNPTTGHMYQLYNTPLTWHESKTACEQVGAHLATITSKLENDFVYNNVAVKNANIWLGGTDEGTEGTWRWITGETWSYTDWSSSPYRQPDNVGGTQNYLAYYDEALVGTWDDQHPSIWRNRYFICEWEPTNNQCPADATSITACGLYTQQDVTNAANAAAAAAKQACKTDPASCGIVASTCPPITSGASATVAANLNIHIPNAAYQPAFGSPMNLWVDLQSVPATDGSLLWKLSNYGINP